MSGSVMILPSARRSGIARIAAGTIGKASNRRKRPAHVGVSPASTCASRLDGPCRHPRRGSRCAAGRGLATRRQTGIAVARAPTYVTAMAVYTEVSDEELEAFLADYEIGEARSCKGIAEGVENSNYLLTTTAGTF